MSKILRSLLILSTFIAASFASGCGYNTMQAQDEAVKGAWGEVLNQYQRRADLIPNLVATVQGYASNEKEILIGITEARSKIGGMNVNADTLNNPEQFAKFQAAQGQLSQALSRLMVVTENYPQLKSDALFRDLQAQLEGTENRIAVARNRFIDSVRVYNTTVRSFPNNLTAKAFGQELRPTFTVENEKAISTAPKVDFGNGK